MKTFQLIQKGDLVFDSVNSVEGIVANINSFTNVASVKTEEEEILSRLADLTILKKSKNNNPKKYTHIKYSDDGGKSFTINHGEKVGKWIGVYTDFSEEDSEDLSDYQWTIIPNDNQGYAGEIGERGDLLKIKIKYFNDKLTRVSKLTQGDWIDLRASKTVEMKAGEFRLIPLGVAMKLPEGYEAIVAPRSSTFKNFGIIETNSIGVIDNSYSGNDDQWFFPAYALRDTTISFDERICQFRIQKRMSEVEFEEVLHMEDENRGGHGSTGTK